MSHFVDNAYMNFYPHKMKGVSSNLNIILKNDCMKKNFMLTRIKIIGKEKNSG